MNGIDYKDYFLHPVETSHRRYEAIRSVLLEEQPMQDVAGRYDISYGTIRNWVSEFCREQDTGQSPPFSLRHRGDVPRSTKLTKKIRKSRLLMFRRCHWRRDAD